MAFIKSLVSRDRNRFQEDGYNLDLTYITDRVLAMGIPATGVSTMWRNNLNDVCEFLEARHKGHFMIWNLTENTYDYDKFNNQVNKQTKIRNKLIYRLCNLSYPFFPSKDL